MLRLKNLSKVYFIGLAGYMLLEILWRGHTHWTMGITGGICFLAVFLLCNLRADKNLAVTCILCALAITLAEFISGCIVNLALDWQVWDYSTMFGNFAGQICILYSCLWYFLSVPLFFFSIYLNKKFFRINFDK